MFIRFSQTSITNSALDHIYSHAPYFGFPKFTKSIL